MGDHGRANGIGLGLRHDLAPALFERAPAEVRWVEIHPENYVARGGKFGAMLERAQETWPIVPHGLSLCFGSTSRFDDGYLSQLRALLDRVEAPWYSDHLCFSSVDGSFLHDLLPIPFSAESVRTVAARVSELRDTIERPVAIENVSYYAHPGPRAGLGRKGWDEVDFLLEALDAADAKLLLDVNNVYVNSINHGFDPAAYIDRVPAERVVQMHVAGHFTRPDGIIIDTHGEPVCEGVYALFEHAVAHVGPVPVLLERDQNFPPLDELLREVRRLSEIYDRGVATSAARTAAPAIARAPERAGRSS